jgi:hypothetical protein
MLDKGRLRGGSDCDVWLSEMPRERRVKEGGRLAHLPMGCETMAASVPDFPFSLANAGKMPNTVYFACWSVMGRSGEMNH